MPREKAVGTQMKTAFLFALFIFCLIAPTGCSKRESSNNASLKSVSPTPAATSAKLANLPAEPPRAGSRRLINAEPSAEALARHILASIARQDKSDLESLRITKQEFCQLVWPELPSSKLPNVTCDFAWEQATLKSIGGFVKMLAAHKGKRYEMVSLSFAKGTDAYRTYKVHKDSRLVIKDENGLQQEIKLFGSVLELDGQFKLFSFVVD